MPDDHRETEEWQPGGELPRLEDATEGDLRLAAVTLGPLAMYGGFLRAVLAGIYAERAHQALLKADQDAVADDDVVAP